MATNFPNSVDNFSNPSGTDSLNSPSHSSQHADANDAIEAIETYVLDNPVGLVHIETQSPSAVSGVNFNNVFSADFDSYKILANITSSNSGLTFRLRASGTDASGSNYVLQGFESSDTGSNISTVTTSLVTAPGERNNNGLSLDLLQPFLSLPTFMFSSAVYWHNVTTYGRARNIQGVHNLSTSYDGFSLYATGMTGTVSVYGYRK